MARTSEPQIASDGVARFDDLRLLLDGQTPSSKYSMTQIIFSIVPYAIGNYFDNPKGFVSYFNFVLFIALVLAFFVGFKPHGRKIALILMTASMFPQHTQMYFGEVLTSVFVAVGYYFLPKNSILGIGLVALGLSNTPAAIPASLLVAVFMYFKGKRFSYFLPLVFACAIIALETYIKYGSVFGSPYLAESERGVPNDIMPYSGMPGFSYPFIFGILSIIFSFGKGLLFFIPSLFLYFSPNARMGVVENRTYLDVLVVFVIGLVLTYSQWWAWYGGVAWGPRFFLIACVPGAILLATELEKRLSWTAIGILLWSAWVRAQGFLYGLQGSDICVSNGYRLELLCWYVPEYSPLFRQYVIGFGGFDGTRILYVIWSVLTVILLLMDSYRISRRRAE